jgi:hypothetical protein
MRITTALLQASSPGADRIGVAGNAVAVLDGATAFEPGAVPAGQYAGQLSEAIIGRLGDDMSAPLPRILEDAISVTSAAMSMTGEIGPSSTAVIVRAGPAAIDLLVLGDSFIFYGTDTACTGMLTDDRIAGLGFPQRAQYRARLAAGSGYDQVHRRLLQDLQREQRQRRNRPGGYWIAQADPAAARHARVLTVPAGGVTWIVAATDGIVNTGLAGPGGGGGDRLDQVVHILATGKPYHELGADYFTRRLDPDRETRRLIARLEALGHHVTPRGHRRLTRHSHHTLTDVTGQGPLPPAQLRAIHVSAPPAGRRDRHPGSASGCSGCFGCFLSSFAGLLFWVVSAVLAYGDRDVVAGADGAGARVVGKGDAVHGPNDSGVPPGWSPASPGVISVGSGARPTRPASTFAESRSPRSSGRKRATCRPCG